MLSSSSCLIALIPNPSSSHPSPNPKLSDSSPAVCWIGRARPLDSPKRRPLDLRSRPAISLLETQNSRGRSLVKSGEAEGGASTENAVLGEQTLRRELELAINEEDYARAAKLRDDLRLLHEDSKASVLAANDGFYHAFRNGDIAAMRSIWVKDDHVYVIHPGAGRIGGYDLVMESWEMVCGADHQYPLLIDLQHVEVHVGGDVGYVTCMEVVKTRGHSWGKQVATNVFERVGGEWFMCIHHASHMDG